MAEFLKRLVIIAGIGVLFVVTAILIGESSKYGVRGPQEIGLFEYLGLKKLPTPTPEARPVGGLEDPVDDFEKVGENVSASPTNMVETTNENSAPATEGVPYSESPLNIQQVPRDAF